MLLADVARFGAHETDTVIAASFSCPLCLCGPTEIALEIDEADGTAHALCSCEPCGALWVVELNDGQSLRMALAPPGELKIRGLG
jgi:hypothetical protein